MYRLLTSHVSSHDGEQRAEAGSLVDLRRTPIPFMRIPLSLHPNFLPKAPPPNTVPWEGGRVSTCKFGVGSRTLDA